MYKHVIAFVVLFASAFFGGNAYAADAACGQKGGTAALKIYWIMTGANCSGRIQAADIKALAALAAQGARVVLVPMKVHKNSCESEFKEVPVTIKGDTAMVEPFRGVCVKGRFTPKRKS